MAITKIKPIKATVGKAIRYIINPEKTDEGLLVSSYGCAPETADIEFDFTRGKSRGVGGNQAYHLIQSFQKEEVKMEDAHRIGKEFADKILEGQYEYVISTHIDKGHIHNHIIFNSVNYKTHKKYHDCKKSYQDIRQISDTLCEENKLSIIETPKGKGKSQYEYRTGKEGKSWKAKLQNTIDQCIEQSKSWEEFLLKMQGNGYEIKTGKFISFKAPGQERFCRAKTIGDSYGEEMIRERILNPVENKTDKPQQQRSGKKKLDSKKINLIADLSKNIKCQESGGYRYRMEVINLKEKTKTLNYLMRNNLENADQFLQKCNDVKNDYNIYKTKIINLEKQMDALSEKIKYVTNYRKHKKIYNESRKDSSGKYIREHQTEIILFEASKRYLEANNINVSTFDMGAAMKELETKQSKKQILYQDYVTLKAEWKEIGIVKKNVEIMIGQSLSEPERKGDYQQKKGIDK